MTHLQWGQMGAVLKATERLEESKTIARRTNTLVGFGDFMGFVVKKENIIQHQPYSLSLEHEVCYWTNLVFNWKIGHSIYLNYGLNNSQLVFYTYFPTQYSLSLISPLYTSHWPHIRRHLLVHVVCVSS